MVFGLFGGRAPIEDPQQQKDKKNEGQPTLSASEFIEKIPDVKEKISRLGHMDKLVENFRDLNMEIEEIEGEGRDRARNEFERRMWRAIDSIRDNPKLWKRYSDDLMEIIGQDAIIRRIPNVDREVKTMNLLERLERGFEISRDDFEYVKGEKREEFRNEFERRADNVCSQIKYKVNPWNGIKNNIRRLKAQVLMTK